MLDPEMKEKYISILKEELVPATGCTEPIAVAYAAARLRAVLRQSQEERTLTNIIIKKEEKSP